MKKQVRVGLLWILALSVCMGGTASAGELEKGFMGTAWGTPSAEAGGLQKIDEKDRIAHFIRPNETFTVGEARLSGLA